MFNCCMPNYNMFMGGCCGNNMMNTMFKMQMFKAIMNNIFYPFQKPQPQTMPQMPVMPMMPQPFIPTYQPAYPSIFSMVPMVNYNNNYYNDNYNQGPSLIDIFKDAYNSVFKKKTKKDEETDKTTDETDEINEPKKSKNNEKLKESQKTKKPEKKTEKKVKKEKKIDTSFKNNGKLGKDFLNRVKKMAKNLNCDYKDLLAVINCESGFNTKANNNGVAVGLTQFTDIAIAELKRVHGIVVTKEQILNMSALEQLDLAEKYLLIAKSYTFDKNARLSADDLYALNFLPSRANREVLCEKGERDKNGKLLKYYEGPGNSGLDKNKDNKITKSELGEQVRNKYVDDSLFV